MDPQAAGLCFLDKDFSRLILPTSDVALRGLVGQSGGLLGDDRKRSPSHPAAHPQALFVSSAFPFIANKPFKSSG